MKRKEFLKRSITGGCACALLAFGGNPFISADDTTEQKQEKDEKQEFITSWTEDLMGIMDKNLDEKTKINIMENSGRRCAQKYYYPIATQFKGNVKGLMERMKSALMEVADYDEKKGTIHLVGKKFKSCICPLVRGRSALKSGTYCYCSQGWMKEVFEYVTGKKADVKLIKTILRGADCCEFNITVT